MGKKVTVGGHFVRVLRLSFSQPQHTREVEGAYAQTSQLSVMKAKKEAPEILIGNACVLGVERLSTVKCCLVIHTGGYSKQVESTYERSRGVAGCDPLKLCAKLTFPPNCPRGFCKPAPLIGTPAPKGHPEPFVAKAPNATTSQPLFFLTLYDRGLWQARGAYLVSRLVSGSTRFCSDVEAVVDYRSRRECS